MDSHQKEFRHVILTKFNLKVGHWHKDKRGDLIDTDGWLMNRINLFEKYCFPSIKNQTNQNFKWIVVFDHTTPETFRNIIDSYKYTYKNFIPLYTNCTNHMKEILKEIGSDSDYLISTRIDNDDAFHKNAIERIQKQFKRQKFEFINLSKGYILDTINNNIYITKETSNPFISLIEENTIDSPFKTVFSVKHKDAGRLGKIKLIKRGVYWIRIIHDRNLSNEVKGKKLRKAVDLEEFNLRCND